jgi:hypothetical protein
MTKEKRVTKLATSPVSLSQRRIGPAYDTRPLLSSMALSPNAVRSIHPRWM